ncbi:MAG: type II toxin-antitoxin system RelE/ParE family toxin [Oscillospiraceae bacterium]|nr:type II toxin-antitoxin system RelE/ParE family toxin [Oscillospiraceae bacterium]
MYKVEFTPYAESQLNGIYNYIANELLNPVAASKTVKEIEKSVMKLNQMPQRIRFVEDEPWKSQGIRRFSVKNFSVYFWIDEENLKIHVVAVAYARRNQIGVLSDFEE